MVVVVAVLVIFNIPWYTRRAIISPSVERFTAGAVGEGSAALAELSLEMKERPKYPVDDPVNIGPIKMGGEGFEVRPVTVVVVVVVVVVVEERVALPFAGVLFPSSFSTNPSSSPSSTMSAREAQAKERRHLPPRTTPTNTKYITMNPTASPNSM